MRSKLGNAPAVGDGLTAFDDDMEMPMLRRKNKWCLVEVFWIPKCTQIPRSLGNVANVAVFDSETIQNDWLWIVMFPEAVTFAGWVALEAFSISQLKHHGLTEMMLLGLVFTSCRVVGYHAVLGGAGYRFSMV